LVVDVNVDVDMALSNNTPLEQTSPAVEDLGLGYDGSMYTLPPLEKFQNAANSSERYLRHVKERAVSLINDHCIRPGDFGAHCSKNSYMRLVEVHDFVERQLCNRESEGLVVSVAKLRKVEPHFEGLLRITYEHDLGIKQDPKVDSFDVLCRSLTKHLLDSMVKAEGLIKKMNPYRKRAKAVDYFGYSELPALLSYMMRILEGHEPMSQDLELVFGHLRLPSHPVSIINSTSNRSLAAHHNHAKISARLTVLITRHLRSH
jgi:hypothetical protein